MENIILKLKLDAAEAEAKLAEIEERVIRLTAAAQEIDSAFAHVAETIAMRLKEMGK